MAKGDQVTNPNTNTSPQWQQLANSNISYPTSIVPQQMMGQMRPMMGNQFQHPAIGQINGMMGNMGMNRGYGGPPPSMGMSQMNVMRGFGMQQPMNPYAQSFGVGQQLGRSLQPMMRSMMPMQSPIAQPTNGVGPNDQQPQVPPQQA